MIQVKEFQAIKEWLKGNPEATYEEFITGYKPRRERVKTDLIGVDKEYGIEWAETWALWPSTNNYEYRGKKYTGSRSMKGNQVVCMNMTVNLWKEKRCTVEEFQRAIKNQVLAVKVESHKTGDNKMQYMNALEVWIRQEKWKYWKDVVVTEPADMKKKSTEVYI